MLLSLLSAYVSIGLITALVLAFKKRIFEPIGNYLEEYCFLLALAILVVLAWPIIILTYIIAAMMFKET